jgi:hypothetical protein
MGKYSGKGGAIQPLLQGTVQRQQAAARKERGNGSGVLRLPVWSQARQRGRMPMSLLVGLGQSS